MKLALQLAAAALFVSTALVTTAHAQVPYSQGTVERVVLLHVNGGHSDALMADLKKNAVPLWESEKAAGIIVDYQIFLNQTTDGSDDWDIGYALIYKNMAALDGLPDKVYDLRMKHYGSTEAEQKVIEKRVEHAHVVHSYLLRDITLR
ncbi:MAG: hypothetical protein P4L40_20840 [Terracidiphilus sp.]|nr:hypothetical protein [Terracidiphilus sp.]